MRRRAFISFLAGTAAWRFASRAVQAEPIRRIGVLLLFSESDPEAAVRVRALRQGLQELGWIEGHNILIEYRFAGGDVDRLRVSARDLVELPVEVIVTNIGHPAGWREFATVPTVFAMVHSWDFPAPSLITSPSHPGGNVTGFVTFEPSIVGKWLEFLKAIAPTTSGVGFLFNPDATQVWEWWKQLFDVAASASAVKPVAFGVHDLAELREALATLAHESRAGLLVFPDVFTVANYPNITALALEHQIPACYPYRYFAVAGGLMSYGPNGSQVFRQAASYVDRILRGAKPGDLPIQQPNAFELVINLKTAKAMRLDVPPWMIARADEVIE
jgi:putative tryptophan/tyrosine transport system substrate-binding protein